MRFLSPKTKVQNYAIPLFDVSEVCSLEHNWRKIPISLIEGSQRKRVTPIEKTGSGYNLRDLSMAKRRGEPWGREQFSRKICLPVGFAADVGRCVVERISTTKISWADPSEHSLFE
jgi:hypothetical protein